MKTSRPDQASGTGTFGNPQAIDARHPDEPLSCMTFDARRQAKFGDVTTDCRVQDPADGRCRRVRDTVIDAGQCLTRAMEPFVQADGSLPRGHGGTGLGLPLSRRLAERHGGCLALQSPPNAGTTARLTLPAAWPSTRLRPPAAAPY